MTAQGEDILAWLDTAITRREEAARDAARSYGARWVRPVGTDVVRISEDGIWFQALSDEIAEHVVCNDPQSVLRRCAADRKLIYEVRRTAENAKNNPWDRMHGYGPYADAMLAAVKVIAEGYGWTGGRAMSVHRLCPRCNKVVRVRVRDGAYGVHRRGVYNCTASGLTPEEVRQGVTALGKRTAEYLASKAKEQTPPTEGDQVT